MPFLEDKATIDRWTAEKPLVAPEAPSMLGDFWEKTQPVGFFEGFAAGTRLENPVLSALRSADSLRIDNTPEEGFNYMNYAKENGVEDMVNQLVWANNTAFADGIVKQTIAERDLRRQRDASGWGGTLGDLFGGVTSPTTLIPGTGLVRAVKGGYAIGASALGVGAMNMGASAIDEAFLQLSQQERSGAESAMAVGSSFLIGSLLGGTAASLLGRVERELVERGWRDLNESTGASAGAEAVRKWSYDDLSMSGWLARKTVDAVDFINPNVRLATSASLVAREIGQMLGENTFYYKLHDSGFAVAPGGSAETEAYKLLRGSLNLGFQGMEDQYKAMKKAGISMSWSEFDEAVGKAMRREDQGANEFISAAASTLRREITDRMKDEAVRAGLLPADIKIEEAASYFSRVYNVEKMIAQEADFKARVMPWMLERMGTAFEEHRLKVKTRIEKLQADLADMRLDKEGRLQALDAIDAQMAELANVYRGGFEVDQEIKKLNREATKAKKEGDTLREADLRAQAKGMADQAAEYRAAVAPVLRRRRVIERGTGGLDRKIEKIQDQLVNLEEANLTSLRRLIAKGQWLQRELGKLPTEDKLQKMIVELNETFNQVGKQFDDGLDRIAETSRKIDEEGVKLKEQNKPGEKTGIERAQSFEEYKAKMAPMQERLAKFQKAQEARRAKLDRIAQQIENAESIDLVEVQKTLRAMTDDLVADVSSMTLGRGERAQRLMDRMDKLDPQKLAEQLALREAKIKELADAFDQRWSVKMLGKDAELNGTGKPDFSIAAKDAVGEIFDAITGKQNLMNTDGMSEWRISPRRGPLKDRTFHIPDAMIEDFLNSSARQVHEIMGRRMAGQIALAKKFPNDPTLEGKLKEIKEDYDKLQARVDSAESYAQALREIGQHYGFKEKIAEGLRGQERSIEVLKTWLNKEMHNDITDVQALRDLILGRFRPDLHSSNTGRTVRALNQINYVRLSGKFLISSLTDIYRIPMMMGMARSMGTLPAMLSNAVTSDGTKAVSAAIREAKLASLVSEQVLHTRMSSIAALGDPFAHGNRTERFIENMTKISTKWNGMALFQDWLESWGSIVAQNKIIDAALRTDPKKLTQDDRWLAMLGVDKLGLAREIATELKKHGEQVGGVWVANTEKWQNRAAIDAYRNALAKEVTRTVIRPSHGDVPTAWKTPIGQGLFQFRSFLMSAHQRIMIAGMQESGARFMSGLIGMITIGMAVSYLKALANGQDSFDRWKEQAKNPMYLLGEGLDNSGLFPLLFEMSNSTEKLSKSVGTSFNPIKSPLKAIYDGKLEVDSQKNWNLPPEQALLGPLAGMLSAGAAGARLGVNLAQGKESTKGEVRQGAAAMPYATHLGFREMIQFLNNDLPYMR